MTELRKTIYLRADKKRVWEYLTDPDKLAIWFHKPTETLAAGADYAMFGAQSGDKMIWGEVIRADPYDYLEYTFQVQPMGDSTSTVKWALTDVPGGTELSLVHSGLPANAEGFGLITALDEGWDKHLGRMRDDAHADQLEDIS